MPQTLNYKIKDKRKKTKGKRQKINNEDNIIPDKERIYSDIPEQIYFKSNICGAYSADAGACPCSNTGIKEYQASNY